jgi:hypothetical protein
MICIPTTHRSEMNSGKVAAGIIVVGKSCFFLSLSPIVIIVNPFESKF